MPIYIRKKNVKSSNFTKIVEMMFSLILASEKKGKKMSFSLFSFFVLLTNKYKKNEKNKIYFRFSLYLQSKLIRVFHFG